MGSLCELLGHHRFGTYALAAKTADIGQQSKSLDPAAGAKPEEDAIRATVARFLDAILAYLRHSPLQALGLLGLFLLAFFLISLLKPRAYGHLIVGDGIGYYAWLRSSVIDFDWDFRNEYTHFNERKAAVPGLLEGPTDLGPTATGLAPNPFPLGSAVLWLPFFLAVHLPLLLAQGLGFPVAADGYSFAYDVAIGLGSVFYGSLGAILTYLFLRRSIAPQNADIAAWSVITIWLASPLFWYAAASGSMSHAPSAFAVSLFLFQWQDSSGKHGWARWASLGGTLGLATLVRWPNALFGILLLPMLAQVWRREGLRGLVRALALLAAAGTLLFSPQMLAWKIVYGSVVTIPQGPDFLVWSRSHLLEVLFSPRNGLFVWTPVALLGVLGLLLALRRYPQQSATLLGALFAEVYLTSVTADWWGGAAFGARRLSSAFLAMAFGLSFLGLKHYNNEGWRRGFLLVGMGFILWNMLFALQHVLHTIPFRAEELTYAHAFLDKVWLPFHLARTLLP